MVLFEKPKRNVTAENKAVLIVEGIEVMAMPTNTMPLMTLLIKDPNNMGQQLPMMIEGRVVMLIWEEQIKLIPRRQLALQMGMVQAYALI